jgi:predicted MFS family arabinose efflux permease
MKSLQILFISNGVFVFASNLLGPLYAIFAQKFDVNILSVSFSWFLFLISTTFFTYIISKFGDRVKEKEYLIIAGFLVRALAWILYIFTTNIFVFLFIQIILGFGEALGSPAFDAIFAKHLEKGLEIKEYSNWKIISNFTYALATITGGIIVYYINFQFLFLIMVILAIISSIIIFIQPRKLL